MYNRHQIVQDYLTRGLSKREIWEKYTGEKEEHGQILRWMRQLGYENTPAFTDTSNFMEKTISKKNYFCEPSVGLKKVK